MVERPPLTLKAATVRRLPEILGKFGIAGGETYDAVVALAAAENGVALATRDARARATYDAVGVRVEIAG
jgi:toxin FitB